ERREAAGEAEGEEWGIDELEDMESEEDEDEEDEDDEKDREEDAEAEEQEMKADALLKVADQAESAPVAEKDDAEVDELADALQKTI
ncbi:hypothetical protein MMC32_005555, partial [Xylographa parallela]|nr:hypothetical protein [Xylographa parallela]